MSAGGLPKSPVFSHPLLPAAEPVVIRSVRSMQRYAAKLLFQYRVRVNGADNKRRTCEERIINIAAEDPETALNKVKTYAKSEQHSYRNADGSKVSFEFVGIMDMMHLGSETEEEEVWYEIKEYLTPKERKEKLLPKEKDLHVFRVPNASP